MWSRKKRCPIDPAEHEWIGRSMGWLAARFGPEPVRRRTILPTPEFFPGEYAGAPGDVRAAFGRVAGYMGVDTAGIDLELEEDYDRELLAHVPVDGLRHGAAGTFRSGSLRPVIRVHMSQAERPMSLIATIAHELGHSLLHDVDRPDLEPLTDLLTVYFGLGIFGANATLEYDRGAWSRTGYLTEPMFGHALAHYAIMRGEPDPAWSGHLDSNPRAFLRKGLRYLSAAGA